MTRRMVGELHKLARHPGIVKQAHCRILPSQQVKATPSQEIPTLTSVAIWPQTNAIPSVAAERANQRFKRKGNRLACMILQKHGLPSANPRRTWGATALVFPHRPPGLTRGSISDRVAAGYLETHRRSGTWLDDHSIPTDVMLFWYWRQQLWILLPSLFFSDRLSLCVRFACWLLSVLMSADGGAGGDRSACQKRGWMYNRALAPFLGVEMRVKGLIRTRRSELWGRDWRHIGQLGRGAYLCVRTWV